MKRSEISILIGFIFTVVISLFSHQLYDAQQVRDNSLRLHIIANSNSEADRQIKLEVRDKILENEAILPVKAENFDEAVQLAGENIETIESNVQAFLAENNVPYSAQCSLENFYFDTTQYDGFVLPKGEYTAFTVRLGKAEGKNWWCVMYPALCSSTVGKIELQNSDDFIKTSKITPRFKVVEIFEDIKHRLTESRIQVYDKT